MKLSHSKLLNINKFRQYILENVSQGKEYVDKNKLSTHDFAAIFGIDPSPNYKFVGWMTTQWVNKAVTDMKVLKDTITKYNTFQKKGKVKTKDIYQFKTFKDLKDEVDNIDESGAGVSSIKNLESDYDILADDGDVLIVSPHTHEASRKLGLSDFSPRNCEDGGKDSAWCTTYKDPRHFNQYYHTGNMTLIYILIKSNSIIEKLKKAFPNKNMKVVALALKDGKIVEAKDGDNEDILYKIETFNSIVGIY